MKTAISLDGELLKEADQTARALGLSRSRLFSLALENYLRHRRQEQILEQLNQTYSDHPDPTEASTTQNMKAKFRSTIKDRW
jgi:metal-responsive CopG/Arc/MetJ family transcriptional regulator